MPNRTPQKPVIRNQTLSPRVLITVTHIHPARADAVINPQFMNAVRNGLLSLDLTAMDMIILPKARQINGILLLRRCLEAIDVTLAGTDEQTLIRDHQVLDLARDRCVPHL